jgi:N-acetylmuramoyl-L-alanine amidase
MRDVLDEVTEARKVVDRVYEICKKLNIECYKYHDTSSSSSQNLANIVNWHNGFKDGVDVSIHFNAYKHTSSAMGTEVYYYSQKELASKMSLALANNTGLKNRGAKSGTGLYFLRNTKKSALLIEVCFGDSEADVNIYRNKFETICRTIVYVLTGKMLTTTTATGNIYRVYINGSQIGAYGKVDNIINATKEQLNKGTKEIIIRKV